jgi:nicotinamide-nucleotide amidase
MKRTLLGVTEASLLAHGAVSSAVAAEMADGASRLGSIEAGPLASASITGIAGPSGGTLEKPVGTVWFAWKLPGQSVFTQTQRFRGDRAQVQAQAAHWALSGLFSLLVQAPGQASAQ